MNARCAYPWQQMIIDLTGEVVPCCYWSGYGNGGKPLGNTNRDSVEDIWNGPGYRSLREDMASGNRDKGHPCDNCLAYRATNGSFPRFSWPMLFTPESGYCHIGRLPDSFLKATKDRFSDAVLYEDGVSLPNPNAMHDEIRSLGAGRYSLWSGWLYFSSSDNSEPITNGRAYVLRCGGSSVNLRAMDKGSASGKNLLLAFEEYLDGAATMSAKPSMISLISTADCNIDCRACSQNHVRLVNVQHHAETVPQILALVPYLCQFIWHGGEPYLIRAFREFVDTFDPTNNPNLTFGFTSNGMMINEREIAKLTKFPSVNASVSIDSFSAETFREIRAGAQLDRVLSNYLQLQATGDWPRRIFSVGMIVCKSNMAELDTNVKAAIDLDIGLNLSPVLIYPVTEQLNVFENFAAQTERWRTVLQSAAAIISEAKAGGRTAITRVDPSGMISELQRILIAQWERHAAIRRVEISVILDYDAHAVMRDPGFIAYADDSYSQPIAYIRLRRGVHEYELQLPEAEIVQFKKMHVLMLHDLLEQGGVVTAAHRSVERLDRITMIIPKFKKVPRRRNIDMASYGVSSPNGLFVSDADEIWRAYDRLRAQEELAGFGIGFVQPERNNEQSPHRSKLRRLIVGWRSIARLASGKP
jgi:MoaA/NifB/PqqE/SkfB family radical SAM enzyme